MLFQRRKRTRRHREEQSSYLQLSEAMDCLEHICTEGCTIVRPYDREPTKHKGPCSKFATCQGVQLLIRHFGTCKKRVNEGCLRCKRLWQLLRLHSLMCDQPDSCRVPLCRWSVPFTQLYLWHVWWRFHTDQRNLVLSLSKMMLIDKILVERNGPGYCNNL